MVQPINSKKLSQARNPDVADPGDGYSVMSERTVRSQYHTEERKDQKLPTPSQHTDSSHSYLDVLYDEWLNKLKTAQVRSWIHLIITLCRSLEMLHKKHGSSPSTTSRACSECGTCPRCRMSGMKQSSSWRTSRTMRPHASVSATMS